MSAAASRRSAVRLPQIQQFAQRRPFGGSDAVHHGIAQAAVAAALVLAQDAVAARTEALDGVGGCGFQGRRVRGCQWLEAHPRVGKQRWCDGGRGRVQASRSGISLLSR